MFADVRDIIGGTLRDVEHIATSPAVMKELLGDLQNAERLLAGKLRKELAKFGALDTRFSGAQAVAAQQQMQQAVAYVQERIAGRTHAQARKAIEVGLKRTVTTLEGLEKRFTGIVQPMRLRQADQLRSSRGQAYGLWARQFPTSVDRYGRHMMGEFEEIIRAGFIAGSSMDDIIAAMTGHGGPKGQVSLAASVTPNGVLRIREADIPEGLFVRNKYWAERILRTEMLKAYNGARQEGLEVSSQDFPDMKRKILAVLDKRTAQDSIGVHGQIRGIKEPFVDGAGRSYLIPPARPNDRETVIPWRPHWEDSAENMSEWEKACIGELDPKSEDALYERMKALTEGKVTPPGEKPTKPPKPPKEPKEAKPKKEPKAKLPPTPMQAPKVRTYAEKIEDEFRSYLKLDKHGIASIDGRDAAFITKNADGTFGFNLNARESKPRVDGFASWEDATKEVMTQWNQRLAAGARMLEPYDEAEYRKAVADGDTSKARRMVRGLLHREGVLPRDAMLSLEANDLELKPATEMGDALAWHSSTGKMAIRSDLWADGTSSDKSKFAEQLATLTHEELHGSTKSNRHGFYVGYGATIEEVTVEMASRKVTRQAGFDYPYTKGSYQQQINQVGGLMQRTYDELGLEAPSNDDALSKIADAGVKMRSGKSKMAPASNEENILDQFLDSLDVPAKVKPALRKHIQAEVKAPK